MNIYNADAIAFRSVRAHTPVEPEMSPDEEAPPGAPATEDNICPVCGGSGDVDGLPCKHCGGSGKVIQAIAGG
ncbi:MAG: hypothetical protein WCA12_15500 [Burkholderiales bacterium]